MPPTITILPLPGHEPPLEPPGPVGRQLELALPLPRAAEALARPMLRPEQSGPTLEEAAAQAGAHAALRMIIEVVDGRRPAGHLDRAATTRVRDYVQAAVTAGLRGRPRSASTPRVRIRSLHLQQPLPGIAEVSAVWQRGGRIAALAARFEQDEHALPLGWRCVALRLG